MLMRAHRGKQLDWSKTFVLINQKEEFQLIQTDVTEAPNNANSKAEPAPGTIDKKQQIIVPKIQIVKRITQPKKFAKIQQNYIRLKQHLNLPKLQNYQLSEVDHVFVQGYAPRYLASGKPVLNGEFLSRAFIQLQRKAGKDPVLPKNKNWLTNFIDREFKQIKQLPNYQNFTQVIYNYWKNRRQQLKFPLLRQLWRPNPEQITYLLAFKTRDKQKKMIRRSVVNRLTQDDKVSQQLQSELYMATKIAERIQVREKLKLKQIQFQLANFHNDCKQFFDNAPFFNQFDPESRVKDKEILKRFQSDIQNIKKARSQQQQKENQVQNAALVSVFDQKQSIAEFLSTVVATAQTFNLSYQKLFNQKFVQKQIKETKISSTQKLIVQVEPKDEKCDYMSMQLFRNGDTIHRVIKNNEDQIEQQYETKPGSIFQYKSLELKSYYFGSDDEGQSKDIKKNTSLNFKKFLSIKK